MKRSATKVRRYLRYTCGMDTFCDVRGKAHTPLGAGAARLVSLVPSTTETLFALGRGDELVGYTRFCVHPQDSVTPDKWIGGTKNPKIEAIIALAPDLVLANREENREADVAALEAAGIAVWVAEPRTVAEAIAEVEQLGRLVGRAEAGAQIAREIRAELPAAPPSPPLSAAYLIWREPYMGAGRETFIAEMLAQGGLFTPFAGRYPELSIGELRAADMVLLASEPYPFAEQHREELMAQGIAGEKIHLVDGELLSWHGIRMRDGLRYVQQLSDAIRAYAQE